MRLAIWNCNGGFHRKAAAAFALDADILVVPECAEPAKLGQRGLSLAGHNVTWVGRGNPNKGLAVFAREPYRLKALYSPDETASSMPKVVAPILVTVPDGSRFDLLAVWSYNHRDKNNVGNPIIRALDIFRDRLRSPELIVAGDFNANAIWDHHGSYNAIVDTLSALGLVSAYHQVRGERHGEEREPTIYWQKRTSDGPSYHIDYIYVPKQRAGTGMRVDVGTHNDWVAPGLSDHVPLVVTLEASPQARARA